MTTWKAELTRVLGLLFAAALIGWVFDLGLWPVVLMFSIIVGWLIWQLHLIDAWLKHRRQEPPPESHGLLGAILDSAYKLRQDGERNRERLQAMVDYQRDSFASMADAVVMLDANSVIEWCNTASATLLNLQPERDVGESVLSLLRSPDFVRYYERESYGEPLQIDSPANRNIKLAISITFFGKGSRLLFARDVTRTHELEEMRRGFVANVSHELRTPLTVISSYIESLSDQPMPNEHWRKAFDQMNGHADRMRQLIEDLMSLSNLEATPRTGSWQWNNVGDWMATIEEEIRVSANGERTVTLDCEDGLQLYGDESELRSAFSNLAVNAARYTSDGDSITISWRREHQRAIFSVTDTGIGIEPGHIPRLTERFYRVDPSRSSATGGTGLGLAIVKHVLMRHRGNLEIQSAPGRGSTFSCRFPMAAVRINRLSLVEPDAG